MQDQTRPGPDLRPALDIAEERHPTGEVDTATLGWHSNRCLGRRRVSGRYQGQHAESLRLASVLDLRIDVDRRFSSSSPIMDTVSGDFYRRRTTLWPFKPASLLAGATYLESWIIDSPVVVRDRCAMTITGAVRFWSGVHPPTKAKIVVTNSSHGLVATAEFTTAGSSVMYPCGYVHDAFRSMQMEIDVCGSVNVEPILPSYESTALADHPADTPTRILNLERAYRETGVHVTIRPARTIVDDSDPSFSTWSVGELHDGMETHFSQQPLTWPRWDMWGLLAGRFVNSGVAGIMFDAAAVYGGAGEAPDRQGCAVFRQHSWFTNLVPAPSTPAELEAMRTFLYTYVHEAGHAFNLLHSWNKGRPDSRSWMNYPHNIAGFYDTFYFRFDDEELLHMRHGDRRSVIMGADDWASGGHMDDSRLRLMSGVEDGSPLEVLLRTREYYDFLEPVSVEVRLRNLLPSTPIEIDTRFSPEYGVVSFLVQRPDGRIIEHDPVFCVVGDPDTRVLQGAGVSVEGADRYSKDVRLTYGKHGFSFTEPGEYRIRAFYRDADGFVTPSNTVRVRVGVPLSREIDRLAQDYFSRAVGLILAVGDHRSPWLQKGADTIYKVIERKKGDPTAAVLALRLAEAHATSFHRLADGKNERVKPLYQAAKPEPERVLALSEPALEQAKADSRKAGNLRYHRVVRLRAACLSAIGQKEKAKAEFSEMRADLAKRQVNKPVLDLIDAEAKSL
jgi:hypothetical protein